MLAENRKDALAGLALMYKAIDKAERGLCGVRYYCEPEIHLTLESLNKLFEGEKASYSAVGDDNPSYYKEYWYNGVKFFALLDKEEYEDETF